MVAMFQEKCDVFATIDNFDFDIFAFEKHVGRSNTLPYLIMNLIYKLPFDLENSQYNEEKMVTFLHNIGSGYRKEV